MRCGISAALLLVISRSQVSILIFFIGHCPFCCCQRVVDMRLIDVVLERVRQRDEGDLAD